MKLFYCTSCRDVVALTYEEVRACRCGQVKGRYKSHKDIGTILIEAHVPYVPLAILNTELGIAAGRFLDSECWWPVACCTMPWSTEPLPKKRPKRKAKPKEGS